jgi:hypothetical protein
MTNTIRRKLSWVSIIFFVSFFSGIAQSRDSVLLVDSICKNYPYIVLDSNRIHNEAVLRKLFYPRLQQLSEGKIERVNIVHIGDSHIQADFFSGTIRENFHNDFGNAGRGFVFPYRVAKTNEPYSYKTSTNVEWDSKRNVFPDKPLPIGAGGITIQTLDSNAIINFTLNEKNTIDYSFNKLTLFHEKGKGNYDYIICDDYNCGIGEINSSDTGSFVSTVAFEKPVKQFILKCKTSDTAQQCSRIYGMLIENGKPGVLYNMIGVNGGEYRYYTMSKYFVEQMHVMMPDLVIVSMGTNEGFQKGFNAEIFYSQIDTLITSLKNKNPAAAILLTTPGDSYRKQGRSKMPNPDILKARETIIKYSYEHDVAYWDLYEVMGGFKSMAKWYASGLTAKDKLHFSKKGYMIQGALFYSALKNSYNNYLKKE